jgi:hypothetical protein
MVFNATFNNISAISCRMEDEIHFLMKCPFNSDTRRELFQKVNNLIKNFENLIINVQFIGTLYYEIW